MGGKVGQAECQKCYIRFPKNKMKKVQVKGNKSGSSFSIGTSGLKSTRYQSGRQYYTKVWMCRDCRVSSTFAAIIFWILKSFIYTVLFLFAIFDWIPAILGD